MFFKSIFRCLWSRYGWAWPGQLLLVLGIGFGGVAPVFAQDLDDVVEWIGSLELEEPEGVFTVKPYVRIDPQGGFIVTDFKEGQVRLYTRSGKLKTYFGEKGTQAPGALSGPAEALRLPTGEILVPDIITGNLVLFDEQGRFLRQYTRIVVSGTVRVLALPDGDVLLIGSKVMAPGAHPLLHRFDPKTGTIRHSFFPHPIPLGSYKNYLFSVGQIVEADVRDNTIVATFSILNKLYFFDLDGNLKREVELPLSHFRKLRKPDREIASRDIFAEELKKHSAVSDLFWIDDRIIVLSYFDAIDPEVGASRWNLAAVTPEGKVLFEVTDTPRLFAVDPETRELFFSHPEHETENYWIVGRLRDQVVQAATGQGR
ncbi:MAG: hypothetical protein D6806_02760 [Deltaproteobacteria bacterium]|nr:MAG: hypothetical protein D6806_02760 [Deltaproteobacteria bacterium]